MSIAFPLANVASKNFRSKLSEHKFSTGFSPANLVIVANSLNDKTPRICKIFGCVLKHKRSIHLHHQIHGQFL